MPDFSAMLEVFVYNAGLAAAVSRETKLGRLRNLGSRLYTRNLTEPPERIVQRNLWPLVAAYLPDAIIADRTALENRPAADGSVFVIADHKRGIALPGVILRPRQGPPPLESDRPFIGSLRNNFLIALKALSQNGIAGARVRTMDFAQRYTAAVDFADLDLARPILDSTHAFADPSDADAAGIRLMLPTPDILRDAVGR